jgi:hypothetical protein
MWGFLKRSKPMPQRRDAVETAFIAQSKALTEIIRQQQATLDRIVTAQYDRPIERIVHPVEDNRMSSWALNDQGDVRPDPIAKGIENLHAESDTDFLGAVQ